MNNTKHKNENNEHYECSPVCLHDCFHSALKSGFVHEITLNFDGLEKLSGEDIQKIMSLCFEYRNRGILIKIRNFPLTLRKQYLLTGLNHGGDEIII